MNISDNYIDLESIDLFRPNFFNDKKLLVIPSIGYPGTNVFESDKYFHLFDSRMEAEAAISSESVFITRNKLTESEESYRSKLFGNRRPIIIDSEKYATIEETTPLDQLILNNKELFDKIKNSITPEHILYGYNQTPNMELIAKKLGIKYYGKSKFALWAGSKIGTEEFAKENGLITCVTLPIHSDTELKQGIGELIRKEYLECVVKINHATGGLGHLHFKTEYGRDLAEKGEYKKVLPPEFTYDEGGVIQGWIDHRYVEALVSIDMLIDFDLKPYYIHAKTRWVDHSEESKTGGYTPITKKHFDKLMLEAKLLADGYIKHNAIGPHCANFMILNEEGYQKYPDFGGRPIYHDENVRPGAGKISQSWINIARTGSIGLGWKFQEVGYSAGTKFSDAVSKLDKANLLIKEASQDAHGCILYNGLNVEKRPNSTEKFNVITISKNNSPEEAAELMIEVEKALKQ